MVEIGWRIRGFTPEPTNDVNLWSLERERADESSKVVALAGSSRSLADLDLATLRERFPNKTFVQLSIDGGSPLESLQSLAEDGAFRGAVLCEVLPHQFFTNLSSTPMGWGPQFRDRPWIASVEARLRLTAQEHLTLLSPALGFEQIVRAVIKRALPKPSFVGFDADRQQRLDFKRTDAAVLRARFARDYEHAGAPLMGQKLAERLDQVRGWVKSIAARGGRVTFIRFPTSPPVRDIEERRFPRSIYWDGLLARTGAPGITPAGGEPQPLDAWTCPDGAHLDYRDAPAFTNRLASAIANRSLLDEGFSNPTSE